MYTFADALEFAFGDALEFMPLACLYVIQFMRTGGITTVTGMIYISRDSDIVDTFECDLQCYSAQLKGKG